LLAAQYFLAISNRLWSRKNSACQIDKTHHNYVTSRVLSHYNLQKMEAASQDKRVWRHMLCGLQSYLLRLREWVY